MDRVVKAERRPWSAAATRHRAVFISGGLFKESGAGNAIRGGPVGAPGDRNRAAIQILQNGLQRRPRAARCAATLDFIRGTLGWTCCPSQPERNETDPESDHRRPQPGKQN